MHRSYHIGVGLLSNFSPISKDTCSVEIHGCKLITNDSSIELLSNFQQLALQGCHDIEVLSNLWSISNLNSLKECYVSSCYGLKYITWTEVNSFLSLEKLILRRLPNFSVITNGILAVGVLSSLKSCIFTIVMNFQSYSKLG